MGVDIESESNGLLDAHNAGIYDVLSAKSHAIRLATETAMTVLRVDQVRIISFFYVVFMYYGELVVF